MRRLGIKVLLVSWLYFYRNFRPYIGETVSTYQGKDVKVEGNRTPETNEASPSDGMSVQFK